MPVSGDKRAKRQLAKAGAVSTGGAAAAAAAAAVGSAGSAGCWGAAGSMVAWFEGSGQLRVELEVLVASVVVWWVGMVSVGWGGWVERAKG